MIKKKIIPLFFLIMANIIPIFGVMFYDWKFAPILILYWLETIVIIFYTALKIYFFPGYVKVVLAQPTLDDQVIIPRKKAQEFQSVVNKFQNRFKLTWIIFFLLGFGIYIALTGFFIFYLIPEHHFGNGIWAALTALFISHGISFYYDYLGKEEYKKVSPKEFMFALEKRFFIILFVIIIGGFVYNSFGNPWPALILMVFLKIFFEIKSWYIEHEKFNEKWIIKAK